MPISAQFRHFYKGQAWQQTRKRILERAGSKCEFCGRPDRSKMVVTRNGLGLWNVRLAQLDFVGELFESNRSVSAIEVLDVLQGIELMHLWRRHWKSSGKVESMPKESDKLYFIKCVLTIAHLNHIAGDDRDENLKALCQFCHLSMDAKQHAFNSRRTRCKKTGQLWLDAEFEATL